MKQIDIFYADDDEDDLMFFNEAIEDIAADSDFRITLHIHKNGERLIENIRNNKDNNGVVFLDINMPFKNGFELLAEIRNDAEITDFPVIMYSTSSNVDYVEKSKQLGANFYVIKPFEFEHLVAILHSFIKVDWKGHKPDGTTFLHK